ncbi:phospho-N-acetylmuramoyl-pentapeptide-transferase [Pyruvatibacter sp.]|uniref:phospho-N-acetylmuramoyl-pentapeptide- transferase n=1 Tax=Pyruvatibacter sp. TaxID=1981328 RepID=UPI0032ED420D
MLHFLFADMADQVSLFNVFRYITFRTGGATLTALLVAFVLGPSFIRWLKRKQKEGQPIREDGPQSHIVAKAGTPTMGGGLILISIVVATLLWADLTNGYVWVVLGVTVGFGLVGFADDYRKVTRASHDGISGRMRLGIEFVIAFIAIWFLMQLSSPQMSGALAVPVFKDVLLQLGLFYIVFGGLVIVGASNAVNLTDGLDGLAIVPVMIAAASFGLIAYLIGNAVFADYLQIHFILGTGELAIICGAILGAGLGFLWFNAPPAMVFMGDTGSLALGGAIGAMAVATKHELVLVIIGGLFVVEALSVIVQVASFKLTGKRVFKMAPIHHHFEQLGWAEPTIVIRFWIIAIILAMIGLSTLKLR